MIIDCFYDFLFLHEDRQFFPKLSDLIGPCDSIVTSRDGNIGMCDVFDAIRLLFIIG